MSTYRLRRKLEVEINDGFSPLMNMRSASSRAYRLSIVAVEVEILCGGAPPGCRGHAVGPVERRRSFMPSGGRSARTIVGPIERHPAAQRDVAQQLRPVSLPSISPNGSACASTPVAATRLLATTA